MKKTNKKQIKKTREKKGMFEDFLNVDKKDLIPDALYFPEANKTIVKGFKYSRDGIEFSIDIGTVDEIKIAIYELKNTKGLFE